MTQSDSERNIRKQFFAYRNGMLADTLRSAGNAYSVIFGLNLHQIVEIASAIQPDANLAQSFWNDRKCREARLIAPMIMPRDAFSLQEASLWCEDVANNEETDVLCHRLLRHLTFATELVEKYRKSSNESQRYLAYRLLLNLLNTKSYTDYATAQSLAKNEMPDASVTLKAVLLSIIDFCTFCQE